MGNSEVELAGAYRRLVAGGFMRSYVAEGLNDSDDAAISTRLLEELSQEWGFTSDELSIMSSEEVDLYVLSVDYERASIVLDKGYRPDDNGYVDVLNGCRWMAGGRFDLTEAHEEWADFDTVIVRWKAFGRSWEADPGVKYYDHGFVSVLNECMAAATNEDDRNGADKTYRFVDITRFGLTVLVLVEEADIDRLGQTLGVEVDRDTWWAAADRQS